MKNKKKKQDLNVNVFEIKTLKVFTNFINKIYFTSKKILPSIRQIYHKINLFYTLSISYKRNIS